MDLSQSLVSLQLHLLLFPSCFNVPPVTLLILQGLVGLGYCPSFYSPFFSSCLLTIHSIKSFWPALRTPRIPFGDYCSIIQHATPYLLDLALSPFFLFSLISTDNHYFLHHVSPHPITLLPLSFLPFRW